MISNNNKYLPYRTNFFLVSRQCFKRFIRGSGNDASSETQAGAVGEREGCSGLEREARAEALLGGHTLVPIHAPSARVRRKRAGRLRPRGQRMQWGDKRPDGARYRVEILWPVENRRAGVRRAVNAIAELGRRLGGIAPRLCLHFVLQHHDIIHIHTYVQYYSVKHEISSSALKLNEC